jgi:hypothetical protein
MREEPEIATIVPEGVKSLESRREYRSPGVYVPISRIYGTIQGVPDKKQDPQGLKAGFITQ